VNCRVGQEGRGRKTGPSWVNGRNQEWPGCSRKGTRWIVVRSKQNGAWDVRIVPALEKVVQVTFAERPERVVVTAIDRAGNASTAKD